MKEVFLVFQKSIIWNYYRKNSLFILVVILFSFGFLSGQEHKAFVKSALKSWNILSFIFLGWTIYAIKTYLFVLRTLNQPDFWFLFNIYNYSEGVQTCCERLELKQELLNYYI